MDRIRYNFKHEQGAQDQQPEEQPPPPRETTKHTINTLTLLSDNPTDWCGRSNGEDVCGRRGEYTDRVDIRERTVRTEPSTQKIEEIVSEMAKMGHDASRGFNAFVRDKEQELGRRLDIAYLKVIPAEGVEGEGLWFARTIFVVLE
ncbi:hypothetical protein BJ508DRAFT_304878 [Ascobolus immersus RN42]|uniref:Uncharacterized protein n=1 Tax=Ascobolus immersus RN42 TaxID=1160509 RepID=A0A3N4IG35_ASCIM|nr:hypothetical protein BJ508DRAFT_304878 [Ascobolus immersus RN42]